MRVNPLADNSPAEREDQNLLMGARSGDRKALEDLLHRHQGWIFNIALRMLYHPQDAEDATQEILVKILTRLSSFEGRSTFRTWLYRIVINHLLNIRRSRVEDPAVNFRMYGEELDRTPDLDLPDREGNSPDSNLLVTEVMLACTSGMLLCLDREQRMAYILGGILGVSDTVAAEVLEITSENFRQRLARSRRDLRNFMNDKCGLVNQANPCRCAKKTCGFIKAGHVDPNNLLFHRERVCAVREAAPQAYQTIQTLDGKCAEIYREHPFYKPLDLAQMVRQLVENSTLRRVTDLS
jgi:RNA polymerase sigma factor (sigma-70 family)